MPRIASVVFLATAVLAGAQTPNPPPVDPQAVLADARTALGGEARLSAIKTLLVTGRTRQVQGDNLVPIEFEMAIELPNKYVRKDEVPAQASGPTTTGFSGDDLLEPPNAGSPAGRPGGPPPPTPEQLSAARAARLIGAKQDFARLMLGLFATSFSSYPLTYTYAGQAEAPQGKADVLEAKGPPNLTLRLFVYRDSHVPVMISWQGAPGAGRGPGAGPTAGSGRGAPPAGAPPTAPGPAGADAATRGQAPAPVQENRIYFADYREVDGVKFPFRLRRALGQDTVEETTFDRFRINTKIDPKKFEMRK
jgi:hypothetical protein